LSSVSPVTCCFVSTCSSLNEYHHLRHHHSVGETHFVRSACYKHGLETGHRILIPIHVFSTLLFFILSNLTYLRVLFINLYLLNYMTLLLENSGWDRWNSSDTFTLNRLSLLLLASDINNIFFCLRRIKNDFFLSYSILTPTYIIANFSVNLW